MSKQTTYLKAVDWLHNQRILCNDIVYKDPSVLDNMRFDLDCDNGEEIYQWFLTDCTTSDVEYLEKRFGLLFTYSDLLGLYVLCVDHWGTSWDYVSCDDNE